MTLDGADEGSKKMEKFISFASSARFESLPFNLATHIFISAHSNKSLMDMVDVIISTKFQRNMSAFLVSTMREDK